MVVHDVNLTSVLRHSFDFNLLQYFHIDVLMSFDYTEHE